MRICKKNANGQTMIEYDPNSIVNQAYTRAYVAVNPIKIPVYTGFNGAPSGKYHPFILIGWQTIKNHFSKELLDQRFPEPQNDSEMEALIVRLGDVAKELFGPIRNFYRDCQSNLRCVNSDLNHSYIRLNQPDYKKYGGDVRVKKVALSNTWTQESIENPDYGFVYDYTKRIPAYEGEENNLAFERASSGVAINEPQTGSEENSYKYVERYKDDIKYSTHRKMFQELPINDALLPGASVGYSQVTVKSLASDYFAQIHEDENATPHGFRPQLFELSSSGQTIYEFFTAKDFPVCL